MPKGKLFVISGASGVGKSTVLKQVMEARKDLRFSVSATTRAPRPGEINGTHYHFISKDEFKDRISSGDAVNLFESILSTPGSVGLKARVSSFARKEISVETIVTNEYIQNTASTGAVNKLEYDKIRNSVQTKNLILLRSKANLIYIFRKDTFTKGNKEDFISFLNGKGVKIK